MATCFGSDRPGAAQGAPTQDSVQDWAPLPRQSMQKERAPAEEGEQEHHAPKEDRPTYLQILKAALPAGPLPCGVLGATSPSSTSLAEENQLAMRLAEAADSSESTSSGAASARDDVWSASEAQPETVTVTKDVQEDGQTPVEALDRSSSRANVEALDIDPSGQEELPTPPDSSDEVGPVVAHGKRRRRHRRRHRAEAGLHANAALDAGSPLGRSTVTSPANRYVVTWGDLGSNLLLGPAGGGTEVAAQKTEPAIGVGACAAFSAWSTLVCKSPDAQISSGTSQSSCEMHGAVGHAHTMYGQASGTEIWRVPTTAASAGHHNDPKSALRSWLRCANGLPSCGELAQQLHTAAPEACADLADLLHAAAPETYED